MIDLAIYSIIAYYAQTADIPVQQAIGIAMCESTMNPTAKNPNSSAKGIFQFVDKTWDWACEGDVMNPVDNTKCFVKLFKKYPHYWECYGNRPQKN